MALIDDLRTVGNEMPPSHTPTANELSGVVGALIAYVEHGKAALDAASDPQKLAELLGGSPESKSGTSSASSGKGT
jgi:hypothetical protein